MKKISLILVSVLLFSLLPFQALAYDDPFSSEYNRNNDPSKWDPSRNNHTHNYMRAESKWEVPYDAEYHEVKISVQFICRLCGKKSYEDEAKERQRINQEGIKLEKHVFDKNGKCTACGYVKHNGNGDVDQDGVITCADMKMMKEYIVGLRNLNERAQQDADLNGDGNINATDVTQLNSRVQHQFQEKVKEWFEPAQGEEYGSISPSYHRKMRQTNSICSVCGETREGQIIEDEMLYHHHFYNNRCEECGYVKQNGNGDVNQDGVITCADMKLLKEYIGGIRDLNDRAMQNADLNGDGFINATDVAQLNGRAEHRFQEQVKEWFAMMIDTKTGITGSVYHTKQSQTIWFCSVCGETMKENVITDYKQYRHHFSGNVCTECTYQKTDKTVDREHRAERFYRELSRYDRDHPGQSGQPGYNPLDDDIIRNMVREELDNSGFGAYADSIINMLWHTDAVEYRELCLWTFFDYGRTVIPRGVTANFEGFSNTMHAYSGDGFNIFTFFHETGHATDFSASIIANNMDEINRITDNQELRRQLKGTIHDIVGGYLLEASNALSQADIEIVLAAIMNEDSSETVPPSYLNETQKDAFTRTLDQLNADYGFGMSGGGLIGEMVLEARGDSVMLADMMCGFTNNKVSPYTIAHNENNSGEDHSGTYWDKRQPYGQTREAYAEYFSSKITGAYRNENRLFSEACDTMDQITHEALERVKEERCKEPV